MKCCLSDTFLTVLFCGYELYLIWKKKSVEPAGSLKFVWVLFSFQCCIVDAYPI